MSESQSWSRFRLLLPRGLRTGALIATTLIPLPLFAQTEAPPRPPSRRPAAGPGRRTAPAGGDHADAAATGRGHRRAGRSGPRRHAEPAVAATTTPPVDDSAKPLDVAVWGRLGNNIASPRAATPTRSPTPRWTCC
jgi:hypothetical protein